MNIIKALRLNQWIKNLIIFIPFITFGNFNFVELNKLVIIFLSFSLIVSSTYILNDLNDIEADKLHPKKKLRPVAQGKISKFNWLLLSLTLFLIGNIIVILVDIQVFKYTSLYVILTLMYSFFFKYIKYFDLLSICLLFIIRLFIGSSTVEINNSIYLILTVFFSSLCLVCGKKISILNNNLLLNNKVKSFLLEKYKFKELNLILILSSVFSVTVYLIWIFTNKIYQTDNLNLISLIISALILILLFVSFYKKTKVNETEEVINLLNTDNTFRTYCIFFIIFSFIGLF